MSVRLYDPVQSLNDITFRQFLFWTGWCFDNNRLLQMPCQHYTSFPDIAQEKSWANIEQKVKIVPNRIITLSCLKTASGSEGEISLLL